MEFLDSVLRRRNFGLNFTVGEISLLVDFSSQFSQAVDENPPCSQGHMLRGVLPAKHDFFFAVILLKRSLFAPPPQISRGTEECLLQNC